MTATQAKDGDVGHLTIQATYRGEHAHAPACYEIKAPMVDESDGTTWIAVDEWRGYRTRGVIGFVPIPLPDASGSMIIARALTNRPDFTPPMTTGRAVDGPFLLCLDVIGSDRAKVWKIVGSDDGRRVHPEDVMPGWVQIDPATLAPVVSP